MHSEARRRDAVLGPRPSGQARGRSAAHGRLDLPVKMINVPTNFNELGSCLVAGFVTHSYFKGPSNPLPTFGSGSSEIVYRVIKHSLSHQN
jgi:hypothetical protein